MAVVPDWCGAKIKSFVAMNRQEFLKNQFVIFDAGEISVVGDKIYLLPDNIANQIAAGEVIQRPASAVKELLENAVDAGASDIQLIIQDAGKSLVQVIDNGSGMSETDARLSFERHATSKIRQIDDLFQIRTMGFRGEALASIAAVAQVELKTRRAEEELGTYIEVENSKVKLQEPIACPTGTSIAMKNLFFNVPARRNFLKSNASEMRHIVEEFTRVALAFPQVRFSLIANGDQLFHLEAGSLKQRIVQLLGNSYNARLVAVKEQTDYLDIQGFVGKPETAKKTRGEQYFFVNSRFIRSPYLQHAVMNAYQELIPGDSFPLFVLFIDLDPAQVDVNVHPTKQEIKFEDEKIVYAFVHAAIKHALAQFSVTPTLDFDLDAGIQQLSAIQQPFTQERQMAASSSSLFRGFTQKHQAHLIEPGRQRFPDWNNLYGQPFPQQGGEVNKGSADGDQLPLGQSLQADEADREVQQLLLSYIVTETRQGFLLVHQQQAHERVLYERFVAAAEGKPIASQPSLFPITLEMTTSDALLLQELLPELKLLGYLVEPFGQNSFIIQGTPADIEHDNEKHLFDFLLEQYKHFSHELKFSPREKLIRSLARQQSIKTGTRLTEREMKNLVQDLFQCQQPQSTPDGRPTFLEFRQDELEGMFRK